MMGAVKCWCGVENPYFGEVAPGPCGGSGTLYCYCGGDRCVCHNHGEVECHGCDDCDDCDWHDFDDSPGMDTPP
jgi:hypothetical protein